MSPKNRSIPWLPALLLAALAAGCGATGGSDPDAVIDAKKITRNLERGEKLMTRASEWEMSDPEENLEGLPYLLDAEELFLEARKLSQVSSKPRIALGKCRALIGLVYYSHYEKWDAEAKRIEESGGQPPASVIQKRDQNFETAIDWLKKSNREFEYYVRFLMPQYPNPFVYELMASNYEYLGEYRAAEQMIQRFMQNVQLSRESRRFYEAKARSLRQRRLDEFEG